MAVELLEEIPDLDCIIAPVSGGGMVSISSLIYPLLLSFLELLSRRKD